MLILVPRVALVLILGGGADAHDEENRPGERVWAECGIFDGSEARVDAAAEGSDARDEGLLVRGGVGEESFVSVGLDDVRGGGIVQGKPGGCLAIDGLVTGRTCYAGNSKACRGVVVVIPIYIGRVVGLIAP